LAFLFAGFWKFGRRQRWAFAVAVGGLCLFVPAFFGVFFAAAVAAVVVRHREALWKYFHGKPVRAVVVALVVLVPLGITVLVSSVALIGTSRNMVAKKMSNAEYLYENAPGAPARSAGAFGGGRGADAGDDEAVESSTDGARGEQGDTMADASGYQGLPARIDIPSDVASTYFHQSMVDRNGRVTLRAWLVSQSVLGALALLCFAVAGLLLFRRRDKVWAWTWAGR
jgi:4-amino-4-deoxy-L-arabinose transferase-like glycosyltransferase